MHGPDGWVRGRRNGRRKPTGPGSHRAALGGRGARWWTGTAGQWE